MPTDLLSAAVPPPGVQPDDYAEAMRKQMVASMLVNSLQSAGQTPSDWNSMRVVPRRGFAENIAPLVTALMAGKATKDAATSQAALYSGMSQAFAPGHQVIPGTGAPLQGAPAAQDPNAQSVQPAVARAPGASFDQMVAASEPQYTPVNPRNPQGLPADVVARLYMTDPKAYAEYLRGPDVLQLARAAGVDPQRAAATSLAKQLTNVQDVRGGGTLFDLNSGQPLFTGPQNGAQINWTPQGPVQRQIPGATDTVASMNEAEARGKAAGTPTIIKGSSGAPIAVFPAAGAANGGAQPPSAQAAPPVAPNTPRAAQSGGIPLAPPPMGNHIMSPTEEKANEGLAKQAVDNYQALNDKASAATNGLRNLSEMKNLLQGFNPGMASGALASMGNVAISLGMDPQRVASLTNVDPGNVEAFEKNTAALASEVVKEFTNRTTQMEFATFMKNNPNPLMSANGLKRVIDFMEKGFNSTIDQQQEAQRFWQANQSRPERFVTDFPAYYNQKKSTDIKAGKYDSLNPSLSSIRTRADVNAAAATQGVVKVAPGMDIDALKKANPPGTVFEFPDGSRGKL